MSKRRGISNWGKSQAAVAASVPVTSFDEIVKQLRLRRTEYLCSQELKVWVQKNKDCKYVPLDLREAWDFEAGGE